MKVLDLFCGVGGAAMGYYQAGFEVIGIDIKVQPNYPFTFIQDDAMNLPLKLLDWCNGSYPDIIHASPPCQGYSKSISSDGRWSHGVHKGYNEPKLIEPLREILLASNLNYVIENVIGSKAFLKDPILLCGSMFGMSIKRHRLFEINFPFIVPKHPKCVKLEHPYAEQWKKEKGITDRKIYSVVGKCRQSGCYEVWRQLMQIPWAKYDYELAGAIPPAYTEYIGTQILELNKYGSRILEL